MGAGKKASQQANDIPTVLALHTFDNHMPTRFLKAARLARFQPYRS